MCCICFSAPMQRLTAVMQLADVCSADCGLQECVPSIWGELHKGGNTRQGGMPPASLGDALYQLPALVLPGVRNSLRELGKLNPIVSQGCNSAHAEIVRMEVSSSFGFLTTV